MMLRLKRLMQCPFRAFWWTVVGSGLLVVEAFGALVSIL